jgi:hypothetical protein
MNIKLETNVLGDYNKFSFMASAPHNTASTRNSYLEVYMKDMWAPQLSYCRRLYRR